jgi:hypothetical protein
MAMDSEHHRAFLLCGGTKTMTVVALDTHRTIAQLPLPQGADIVKFDLVSAVHTRRVRAA